MNTPGIDHGIVLRMLPIKTVGLPVWRRYYVWLFNQRRVEVVLPFHVPRPNGGSYIMPRGFEFDGGSIPRWLLVLAVIGCIAIPMPEYARNITLALVLIGLLIERFGLMLYSFAVHDFSVRYGLLVTGSGEVEWIGDVHEANETMRRTNFATNNMKTLGWIAHLAVMLGAWRAWDGYRKGRIEPDESWRSFDYGVKVR